MNSYTLRFSEKAKDDIRQQKNSGNLIVVNKIRMLLEELAVHPYSGIGKPEPLKHSLSGCWSRRINREHQLVYEVVEDIVVILSAKGHYA